MADYQILCVNTERPHRHIVSVGTGPAEGPVDQTWTVKGVRKALKNGDRFYTMGPKSHKTADVRRCRCREPGCEVKTIRSENDAVRDNNLDNLAACD
jgi:hypothetical protein